MMRTLAEGDIVVAELPQADGQIKRRPVLLLRVLPRFNDFLVCGISTQIHQAVLDFDAVLQPGDPGFASTGLKAPSVIRLAFLAVVPEKQMVRHIGRLDSKVIQKLQSNLASYLCAGHASEC